MGKSWCILCYWVLELPVRLGKGIGRTHGPPLPSSLHTQNGVVLERYPTCSLRNKMLLKSHWDPRILPLRLYNLGTPSEKVGSCRTQGNPTILGTYLQDPPASNTVLDQRLLDSPFISILGWEVGCKRRRKVFLKFP